MYLYIHSKYNHTKRGWMLNSKANFQAASALYKMLGKFWHSILPARRRGRTFVIGIFTCQIILMFFLLESIASQTGYQSGSMLNEKQMSSISRSSDERKIGSTIKEAFRRSNGFNGSLSYAKQVGAGLFPGVDETVKHFENETPVKKFLSKVRNGTNLNKFSFVKPNSINALAEEVASDKFEGWLKERAGKVGFSSGPWRSQDWKQTNFCSNAVAVYGSHSAIFHDVVMDKSKIDGPPGGENVSELFGVDEKDEFYKITHGAFVLPCYESLPSESDLKIEGPLGKYVQGLNIVQTNSRMSINITETKATIIVVRNEYANVYWALVDMYNAFLTFQMLNIKQGEGQVFLFDGHPRGHLDNLWEIIFPNIVRLGTLQETTQFRTLIWQFDRDHSPLLTVLPEALPPYYTDFQSHLLRKCELQPLPVQCQKPVLLFIWRRNYVAHARNPSGVIKRKIGNEAELIKTINKNFPSFIVKAVQLDVLPICQQVSLMANADIVVAMHGAAVAYSMFMKPHAGLVEIYPPTSDASSWHMRHLARWSKLNSVIWIIADFSLHDFVKETTIIPPDKLTQFVRKVYKKMCSVS